MAHFTVISESQIRKYAIGATGQKGSQPVQKIHMYVHYVYLCSLCMFVDICITHTDKHVIIAAEKRGHD